MSDLHLGKAGRPARQGEALLSPYQTPDTLARLEDNFKQTGARHVTCLGDSFDDLAAVRSLNEAETLWVTPLKAGRHWVWIEGNQTRARLIWVVRIGQD